MRRRWSNSPTEPTEVSTQREGGRSFSPKNENPVHRLPGALLGDGGVAPAREVDAQEGVAELAGQRVEAGADPGPSRSAGPAPGSPPPRFLDRREVGGGEIEVGCAPLPTGNGNDGCASTGAATEVSTIIASAKPPVKHIPSAPTLGPPSFSWSDCARLRSHVATGEVAPTAMVVNLC